MKTTLIGAASAALLFGCVTAVPPELIDARLAYQEATKGEAAREAPQYLADAERALRRADQAYQLSPRSEDVRDLAYVARRKVEIAESRARLRLAEKQKARAEATLRGKQQQSLQELSQARAQLAEQERQRALQARQQAEQARQAELAAQQAQQAEQEQRLQAERDAQARQLAQAQDQLRQREEQLAEQQRAIEEEHRAREEERAAREQAEAKAMAALENLGQVKQEARGTVITLPGSLLFASGKTQLGPAAKQRLDKVADALKQTHGQKLVIEGHSDSRGSDDTNQQLSYLRALAVRDYLVQQGVAAQQVEAKGFGEERPIADNATAEGRATNRRVEIVVENPEQGTGGSGHDPMQK